MLLYQDKRSPNPRRVRIFAAEKGIDLETRNIDVLEGEHRTPEFTAKNPMQRVPVLELDDGSTIAESVAICRYLEILNPQPSLMGSRPLEQAVIEQWNRWLEMRYFEPVSQCFRHGYPGAAAIEEHQIGEWAKLNKARAEEMLVFLNAHMAERDYFATEDFTIADITALVATDFLKAAQLALSDEHPHLKRWHAAVSERSSAAA